MVKSLSQICCKAPGRSLAATALRKPSRPTLMPRMAVWQPSTLAHGAQNGAVAAEDQEQIDWRASAAALGKTGH